MSVKTESLRQRRSLFFPLLLIAVGVVFLLDNLGALQGDAWSYLASLWPVILIVIGLDSIYRGEGIVGAAFMIGLGVVFLLANLGYLDLNIWQLALRLWPLLLVAIGFDILIGRRSWLASLAGLVVILALLAGALWLFGVRVDNAQPVPGETIRQALGNAGRGRVALELGAGTLQVDVLSEPGDLVAGSVSSQSGQQPKSSLAQEGDLAVYSLRSRGVAFYNPGRRGAGWDWDLGLTRQVPVELQVNLGAGEAEFDLWALQADDLNIDLGVGQATLTLPAEGHYTARLNGAIGSLNVLVPSGLGVRVDGNTALASLQVPPGYQKDGDVYLSPDYATAENRVDLSVGMAIGSIQIQER